jgi:hypothetical protein
MRKSRIVLVSMLALVLSLACGLSDLTGDSQMQATAVALQATQAALDMKILELQQQQTAVAQQPTAVLEVQAAAPDGKEVDFEGIRFTYDPALASGVESSVLPPAEDMVGVVPEHVRFVFRDYAWNGSMHTPAIYIYPVDAYRTTNEYVNENIDRLIELLGQRPAEPGTIPFLPVWNAAQMIASNVEYMDFQNGSGVRYLSQYGQAIYPINNNGLFYTFQGITSDGAWYVAVVMPVAHPMLPSTDEPPGGDWEAFSDQFEAYLSETKALLETQSDVSFTPDLRLLDAMARSLQVK